MGTYLGEPMGTTVVGISSSLPIIIILLVVQFVHLQQNVFRLMGSNNCYIVVMGVSERHIM